MFEAAAAFGIDRADEAGGGHAGVMHAGDGAAHDDCGQQQALAFGEAAQAAQAEAHPEGQRGQHHGDDDRQAEGEGIVAQVQAHLHAGHAGVVHRADAGADQHAAHDQAAGADALARDQGQRHVRGADARQIRQNRDHRVVIDLRAQIKGEHADEVHGPDAGAERQAAGEQEQGALARLLACLAGDLQAHPGGEDRHQQGQQDQFRIVDPVTEQRRIVGQHEKRHGRFRGIERPGRAALSSV